MLFAFYKEMCYEEASTSANEGDFPLPRNCFALFIPVWLEISACFQHLWKFLLVYKWIVAILWEKSDDFGVIDPQ